MSSAAVSASSTLVAGLPAGTGTPCRANSCLPWYSSRSMSGDGLYPRDVMGPPSDGHVAVVGTPPHGAGSHPNGTMPDPMALPTKVNWVTFDVYGTLIDWE